MKAGYYEEGQFKDRLLSDWEGDWQSVYPFLLDGSLDEVTNWPTYYPSDLTTDDVVHEMLFH
ncbi:ZinT/AdcA family metal-binding protein [Shouchella miscanthi]|uniref:ZinT/AdcA family metal-binding protein n=1 Tax=Shouchella miscanthi TaxID=2598861 RepID=A0ABU6NN24_9BACI|nr:ZinT/AdcA family metal-binding protein [Shouchella miscanthi]MED4128162.1 ZinT/AdcA family metal-binding protein [Shouchella miscanthi]